MEAIAQTESDRSAGMNEAPAAHNNEKSSVGSPQKKDSETLIGQKDAVETVDAQAEQASVNAESEGKNGSAGVKTADAVEVPDSALTEGEKQQGGEETAEAVTENEAPQPEEAQKDADGEKRTHTQQAKEKAKSQTPTPKRASRIPVSSVGKSGVKGRTTPAAKKTPPANMPSSAKVTSSSKRFEVLHAKQLAKEPTIYEHDKAKKAKADSLPTFPATRTTRSSTKKEPLSAKKATESAANAPSVAKKIVFKPTRKHVSVAEKPTISSSLKRTSPKRVSASASRGPKAPFTSTVTTAAKKSVAAKAAAPSAEAVKASGDATKAKKSFSYKPYTGPLPKYKEDPIFSPVDKSKIEAAKENAKPKPVHHTPAKKKASDSAKPGVSTPAAKASVQRASVKKSADVVAKAKEDRRTKFAQDANTKAAASRQSPRKHGAAVAAQKAA